MGEKNRETILAIDDENDVLLIIRTALESEGYGVLTASNGIDGLALAEDEQPDLILLDLMMPEMSGEEFLLKIKESEKTETLKVIVLTALAEKKMIRQLLDQGADAYIVKPFECQELLDQIRMVLDEERPF